MIQLRLTAWLYITLLFGCATVRLISDYDEPTDIALTAIQQTSDDFIAKLIAEAPSDKNAFAKHEQFYHDVDQQLRRLEFRVAAIPKNTQTMKLIGDIRASLLGAGDCSAAGTSLRDLHCNPEGLANGPSRRSLEITRRNVNQTIAAALALELAKRQGLEQNN